MKFILGIVIEKLRSPIQSVFFGWETETYLVSSLKNESYYQPFIWINASSFQTCTVSIAANR